MVSKVWKWSFEIALWILKKFTGDSESERTHKRCWLLLTLCYKVLSVHSLERTNKTNNPSTQKKPTNTKSSALTPRSWKHHGFQNNNILLYSSEKKSYSHRLWKNYMQVGCHNSRIWLHLAQEAEGVKTLMLTHYPDG